MPERVVNRIYRDRLFKFIFGNPENKAWTLSLYNAVNGTEYSDVDSVQLNTVEDAVYMNMKNDVSFLFYDTVNLYEQQSTFNPNMPVRFLIYAGMLYARYVETVRKGSIYGSSILKLPLPKCVCFYNGKANKEDVVILNLSDSFDEIKKAETEADITVRVTMININYGHNDKLLNRCKPMNEYSWFVDKISNSSESLDKAVDRALEEMPDDFVIKQFLLMNRAEVKRMCITEYDEEKTLAYIREESKAEGIAEGKAEGKTEGTIEVLISLVKDGILTVADAAKRANIAPSAFEKAMNSY